MERNSARCGYRCGHRQRGERHRSPAQTILGHEMSRGAAAVLFGVGLGAGSCLLSLPTLGAHRHPGGKGSVAAVKAGAEAFGTNNTHKKRTFLAALGAVSIACSVPSACSPHAAAAPGTALQGGHRGTAQPLALCRGSERRERGLGEVGGSGARAARLSPPPALSSEPWELRGDNRTQITEPR